MPKRQRYSPMVSNGSYYSNNMKLFSFLFLLMASTLRQIQAFSVKQNVNRFAPFMRIGTDKSQRNCPRHYVYTPEQQEDFEKEKEEEDNNSNKVSGEVLGSLLKKLDKSKTKEEPNKKENKAMAFLRKKGKVGGNQDFTNAIGSDEGSGMSGPTSDGANAATSPLSKAKSSYQDLVDSGVIDDLSESFPLTSSGSEWRGTSDRIKGGTSEGAIRRETVSDKVCNVLVGQVSNEPEAFLQMITDLSGKSRDSGVDASGYDGIELDILSQEGFQFNVHLRSAKFPKNSYCHTATLDCLFGWSTIRIPFTSFVDPDDGTSVDTGSLSRIGIVALEPESLVNLAVSGVRFYSVI
ncbi:unnamed protein product [Cylindrotheca closterium]|uniref:NADH:ubiquinone oxidoreductase intermediate-associated protein 30 domain-containing protein n=1 Tax=Cylindrotheca closterium TaxID=2856 RepID=A0AAD2FH97_9STRA|nr:unnamed protein product [Cylindrotheca closterium]